MRKRFLKNTIGKFEGVGGAAEFDRCKERHNETLLDHAMFSNLYYSFGRYWNATCEALKKSKLVQPF